MKLALRRSRKPRLRIKTIMDLLKNMDVIELIFRSFCSKFLKSYLKSAYVNDAFISVRLRKQLCIELSVGDGWTTLNFSQENASVKIDACPNNRRIDHKLFDAISGCLNFTGRDFLLHFMGVFNNPAIRVVYDDARLDEESVQSLLADIPIVGFTYNIFKAPNKMLQHALNNTKCFEIHGQTSSHSSAHPILSKNFDKLVVGFSTMDLNSLLNMSSPIIVVGPTIVAEEIINVFLKLWVTGCANINLKLLEIYSYRNRVRMLDEDVICKGIKYLKQPNSTWRTFRYMDPEWKLPRSQAFNRDRNIQRNDGVEATILCKDRSFSFMVWD